MSAAPLSRVLNSCLQVVETLLEEVKGGARNLEDSMLSTINKS